MAFFITCLICVTAAFIISFFHELDKFTNIAVSEDRGPTLKEGSVPLIRGAIAIILLATVVQLLYNSHTSTDTACAKRNQPAIHRKD
jgi:hypothetical protein